MKPSQLKKLTQEIMDNPTNQARISEILADIIADNNEMEEHKKTVGEEINSIREDNEALRKANNKLFVQLGSQNDEDGEGQEDPKGKEQEEEGENEELPSIEDLLKEV